MSSTNVVLISLGSILTAVVGTGSSFHEAVRAEAVATVSFISREKKGVVNLWVPRRSEVLSKGTLNCSPCTR